MKPYIRVLAPIAMLLLGPDPTAAQESRAELIRQDQAEKQVVVTPPQASRAERFIERLSRWGLISGTPHGLYPWLGFVLAEISANGGQESWRAPAHVYFLREAGGWKLVGFERVPKGVTRGR